jgi:hypothetical protein
MNEAVLIKAVEESAIKYQNDPQIRDALYTICNQLRQVSFLSESITMSFGGSVPPMLPASMQRTLNRETALQRIKTDVPKEVAKDMFATMERNFK